MEDGTMKVTRGGELRSVMSIGKRLRITVTIEDVTDTLSTTQLVQEVEAVGSDLDINLEEGTVSFWM